MRGRKEEDWIDMLPRLRKILDGNLEKTLRVSYDGLDNQQDKAIFRHIACLFHYENVDDIKCLLARSDFDVNIGIKNLVDKSLIHIRSGRVVMHCLLQKMGREIVRSQSSEPGEREFLVDSKDISDVFEDNNGTKKILGITLAMDEMEELYVHKKAFKGMRNLQFLNFSTWMLEKESKLHLPEDFDYLPSKLRLLSWDRFPMKCMPSKFCFKNLVKLKMWNSKLEKLWEGVGPLAYLKDLDLRRSQNLREIPDLSMATNLESLVLDGCSSLVEVHHSSIQNLNKLRILFMLGCTKLENLLTRINLESLNSLGLTGCSRLRNFPDISRNISKLFLNQTDIQEFPSNLRLENLTELHMVDVKSEKLWEEVQPLGRLMTMFSSSLTVLMISEIPSLVDLPSYIGNLYKLEQLGIKNCTNLETLPSDINLKYLDHLDLSGCIRLRSFPCISNNIASLLLNQTSIEQVPWWIKNFTRLDSLYMRECNQLKCFEDTVNRWWLTEADIDTCVEFDFMNCFELDQEALLQQHTILKLMILPGEQVPSYFTHRNSNENSLAVQTTLSQPVFRFRACTIVDYVYTEVPYRDLLAIQVKCRFGGDILGNQFDRSSDDVPILSFTIYHKTGHLVIFDCCFPLDNKDNASLLSGQVDIEFHLLIPESRCRIKGCGIRVFENCPSPNENDDGGNETKESGDRDIDTLRSTKRMRII